MGLGSFESVSLQKAREKATHCREQLSDGIDPIEQRAKAKQNAALDRANKLTFSQCATAYIEAHQSGWKNAKHAAQWVNTINTYANPEIGHLPVAEVDTAMVVRVLSPIWLKKTETAQRLRGRIEAVLGWAATMGHRHGDNPARWRGHLDNVLANINKVTRTVHQPALPWKQMPSFIAELGVQGGFSAKAVELAILTAARSGEVRLMRWNEVDLDAATWVIPAQRMKAGREHWVPLSKQAVKLLSTLPRVGELVFPGLKGGSLSDMSLTAVLRRMNGDTPKWVDSESARPITVHGFRASFRTWCSESVANSFPSDVAEHALAHKLPDQVEAAYQRGNLFEKRIALMQAWADFCYSPTQSASITPIRGTALTTGT